MGFVHLPNSPSPSSPGKKEQTRQSLSRWEANSCQRLGAWEGVWETALMGTVPESSAQAREAFSCPWTPGCLCKCNPHFRLWALPFWKNHRWIVARKLTEVKTSLVIGKPYENLAEPHFCLTGLPDLTEPRHWPFVSSGALAPLLPLHGCKIQKERKKGKAASLLSIISVPWRA